MIRLALTLFSMIATSLAGIGVIVVLTLGHDTLVPILIGAAVGFFVAIPVTWIVAKKIATLR